MNFDIVMWNSLIVNNIWWNVFNKCLKFAVSTAYQKCNVYLSIKTYRIEWTFSH